MISHSLSPRTTHFFTVELFWRLAFFPPFPSPVSAQLTGSLWGLLIDRPRVTPSCSEPAWLQSPKGRLAPTAPLVDPEGSRMQMRHRIRCSGRPTKLLLTTQLPNHRSPRRCLGFPLIFLPLPQPRLPRTPPFPPGSLLRSDFPHVPSTLPPTVVFLHNPESPAKTEPVQPDTTRAVRIPVILHIRHPRVFPVPPLPP